MSVVSSGVPVLAYSGTATISTVGGLRLELPVDPNAAIQLELSPAPPSLSAGREVWVDSDGLKTPDSLSLYIVIRDVDSNDLVAVYAVGMSPPSTILPDLRLSFSDDRCEAVEAATGCGLALSRTLSVLTLPAGEQFSVSSGEKITGGGYQIANARSLNVREPTCQGPTFPFDRAYVFAL